uniref:Zona pellucida binding protein 2 n=1 Tax=Molossus molossus TaxID=27622 RepID=A0A7J8D456_MOLMO|nr:zona pellucida binding protein 2 [Molossus molossus]
MRAWLLVSAVLWYLTRVGWQRFSEFSEKGFVYGTPKSTVKIYVELHHNSPFLVCMDLSLAKKETVDPTYLWIGPNEKPLTGSYQINITQTGKLMVKDFLESLSGLYTCTLSYKIIKSQTQEEKIITQTYDFMMFVSTFAPQWKSACNDAVDCEDNTNYNVLQARDRIEEFFRSQAYVFYHNTNKTLPAMHFMDHSFQMARMDSCRAGFGKNEGLHSNCATCCVVCGPGTFSRDADVTCETCSSILNYGAKVCP